MRGPRACLLTVRPCGLVKLHRCGARRRGAPNSQVRISALLLHPSTITQPPLLVVSCCTPLFFSLSFQAAGFDSVIKHSSCLAPGPTSPYRSLPSLGVGEEKEGTGKASPAQLKVKVMRPNWQVPSGKETKMYTWKINDRRSKKKSVKSKCRIRSQKFYFQQQILTISSPLKKIN